MDYANQRKIKSLVRLLIRRLDAMSMGVVSEEIFSKNDLIVNRLDRGYSVVNNGNKMTIIKAGSEIKVETGGVDIEEIISIIR